MKKTIVKTQPLVDFVNSFDTPTHPEAVLELITEDHGNERLRAKGDH